MNIKDPIVEQVKESFDQRSQTGIEKYGKTLGKQELTFTQWMQHLQEELMDATLYIEKIKNDLNGVVITRESWEKADKIIHEGFVYVKYTDLSQI